MPQRRPGGLTAGVVADHAAAPLPSALAFDLVSGAPFWAMRRAMPTLPLWCGRVPQSASPAALVLIYSKPNPTDLNLIRLASHSELFN